MTGSDRVRLRVLELALNALNLRVLEVESTSQRMKALEVWQATMDMTLKNMSENN